MIQFVRNLNEPYKRSDFVIGGLLKIADGIVDIVSFGYFSSNFHIWCLRKNLDKFFSHREVDIND